MHKSMISRVKDHVISMPDYQLPESTMILITHNIEMCEYPLNERPTYSQSVTHLESHLRSIKQTIIS